MATKNGKTERPVGTGRRGRPPRRDDAYKTPPATPAEGTDRKHAAREPRHDAAHEKLTPHELYRLEKARRQRTPRVVESDPLEAARREYKALLEADAARGKGGRPRKNAAKPAAAADEVELDEHDAEHDAPDEEAVEGDEEESDDGA